MYIYIYTCMYVCIWFPPRRDPPKPGKTGQTNSGNNQTDQGQKNRTMQKHGSSRRRVPPGQEKNTEKRRKQKNRVLQKKVATKAKTSHKGAAFLKTSLPVPIKRGIFKKIYLICLCWGSLYWHVQACFEKEFPDQSLLLLLVKYSFLQALRSLEARSLRLKCWR